jgi:hypothetical protein
MGYEINSALLSFEEKRQQHWKDLRYIIVYCRMISFFLSLSLSFSFEEKTDENVINTDGSSNWRDDELSTDIILLYLD